jgi:hypothetical protein
LLLIGIARAWELVGDRDTGIITSIAVLAGYEPDPDDPSSVRAPRAGRRRSWLRRAPEHDPPHDRPE